MNYLKLLLFLFFVVSVEITHSQHWQSTGANFDSEVRCMFSDTISNQLYVGGSFQYSGNIEMNGISKWDGIYWDSLAGGEMDINANKFCCYPILTIAKFQDNIFVGGMIGGLHKWNGTKWDFVNGGPEGNVYCAENLNNLLYVSYLGNNGEIIISHWDGIIWTDLGFPYSGSSVSSMLIFNGKLYVAGLFQDNTNSLNIATWDGNIWNPVGGGIKGNMAWINCMKVYKNELYVGGRFNTTNGNYDMSIQKWDGNNWLAVGGGIFSNLGYEGQVETMIEYKGDLYVGGGFTYAGGISVSSIAKWDGIEWCGLGIDIDNKVVSMVVFKDSLYIGGGFKTIDGDTVNHIAKWTGGSYVDTCGTLSAVNEMDVLKTLDMYPNPAKNKVHIRFENVQNERLFFSMYDILGKEVEEKDFFLNGNEMEIPLNHFAPGIYFYRIRNKTAVIGKGKLIIE